MKIYLFSPQNYCFFSNTQYFRVKKVTFLLKKHTFGQTNDDFSTVTFASAAIMSSYIADSKRALAMRASSDVMPMWCLSSFEVKGEK